MKYMLCYNKVKDYKKWREVFDSYKEKQIEAGLVLTNMFRDISDSNIVHFIFKVENIEKAKKYLADPVHIEIGKRAGVMEGTIQYLDKVDTN
ncbi:MAG: hypothetical protein ABFS12_18035 [Bacteroidota bacterium]